MAFSCDAEVLKNNEDYQRLLQTLALLQAQKIKAIEDLEKLQQLQSNVEKNPQAVYRAIAQDKVSGNVIPQQQTVASLPEIDWSKYCCDLLTAPPPINYNTRKKRGQQPNPSCDDNNGEGSTIPHEGETVKRKTNKSASHGQPWTEEEQRRLEELLKIYPSEEVEAKRWQKIAKALGNRTTKQVCCRVQKYFIKLAKAGLPVPGRMPNLAVYSKKTRFRRSSTRQPSLFFNSLKPKVYMNNTIMASQDSDVTTSTSGSSTEDDDDEISSLPHPLSSPIDHTHFHCNGCECKLDSIYWKCKECTVTMLLCLECVKSSWNNEVHHQSHEMSECLISKPDSGSLLPLTTQYLDSDYSQFKMSSSVANYNYLDPNFCPAL